MDYIEISILQSLILKKRLGFEELISDVKNQTKKSRQTINTRLHILMKDGYVEKRKRKYFLTDSEFMPERHPFNRQVVSLRLKTNKTLKSRNFYGAGSLLINEIFYGVYAPRIYEKIMLESVSPKGKIFKMEQNLKKCERMIQEISVRLFEEVQKKDHKESITYYRQK